MKKAPSSKRSKSRKRKHPADSIRSIHPFPAKMPATLVWDLLTQMQADLEGMLMGETQTSTRKRASKTSPATSKRPRARR